LAAETLGKTEDAEKYGTLCREIKQAFNKAYVAPDGRIKGNTQTCYVLALAFALLPPEKGKAAARYLLDDIKARGGHLSTGFVGTSQLMPMLSMTGNTATAYRLLLTDTFPSWGYTIKSGATTIWERWDGWTAQKGFQDPGMNSFSHYAFGAVGRWLFQSAAGIDMNNPGFHDLSIRPTPDASLRWLKASYDSIHGRIAVNWQIKGEKLILDVTIPANANAYILFPIDDVADVRESGKPVGHVGSVVEIAAGHYHFVMPWQK